VNGTLSYLVTDLLSNVVMAIGASGTVAAVELYEPYGQMNYSWGSMPTDKNYTGQQLDSQSGLLYYQFRWYDPLTGEFTRTDTKQDNANGMNPYAYVSDNPETKNDPTGHWGWGAIALVVAIVVVVVVVAIVAAPVLIAAASATAEVAADGAAVGAVAEGAGDVAGAAAEETASTVAENVVEDAGEEAVENGVENATENAAEDAAPKDPSTEGNGDEGSNGCGDDLSFRSTTPVATSQGEQAIGTLKVGQKVLAYNPQTQKMEQEPIEKVWLNYDKDLVDLTLVATVKDAHGKATQQKEAIHTNEKHPFLTKEKGFIPVSQLKPGMHILEANGSYGVVATLVLVPGGMWMYNLTVTQDHTYAVGLDQWIVHNCGDDPPDGWTKENYGPDNKEGVSDFTHIDENGNRLEATLFHDSGELQIPWMDSLSQAKANLPSLIDWLGDSVQTIKGYVTDNLGTYFSPVSRGTALVNRVLSPALEESGFSPGTIQAEGSRLWMIFSRL
jgi:RHS repeat-associated protein